ncbi:hypothetical protein EKN56_07365 [Limnobaculum zhutongyuii]|uniref:Uncharacterized protein n=1 Tax=Limnobaculum zhutongyuii TaxID=2498113 RepID=A0A411WJ57_9GAMM|nr:hypothetical protein [Limnobaculum zhutongyuii]QBH96235.1 hypothetical protein EKN56_07365 [Limnobaculum zhutongyuii]TQS87177.1 hypothetical protein ELQ32_15895 [Limnobaculum zhutongyuii]
MDLYYFNIIIAIIIRKNSKLLGMVISLGMMTHAHSEIQYNKECLGHYKFDLPTQSYPALLPIQLLENRSVSPDEGRFLNGDQTFPYYENHNIYVSYWYIINLGDNYNINSYMNKRIDISESIKRKAIDFGDIEKKEVGLSSQYERTNDTLFLINSKGYSIVYFSGNYAYYFDDKYSRSDQVNIERVLNDAHTARSMISPRKLNEIPKSGLCIPMATLKKRMKKIWN